MFFAPSRSRSLSMVDTFRFFLSCYSYNWGVPAQIDQSDGQYHTLTSQIFFEIRFIWLSYALSTAVQIFLLSEQWLPSYSLGQFREVMFHAFLSCVVTPSRTVQNHKSDIPLNSPSCNTSFGYLEIFKFWIFIFEIFYFYFNSPILTFSPSKASCLT